MPNARLYAGSDDYIKVWVNGKLVHSYNECRRASEVDQDKVEGISLKKGYNHVVVKCVDVVYGWEYYLRFTDSNGHPLKVLP